MKRSLVLSTLSAVAAATLLSSLVTAPAAVAATVNPILGDGSYYSADPTLLVDDDTLYLHAGRDEAGPTTNDFIMNEWQAFSTTDVDGGQWTHHPSLMRPENVFSWATPGRAYAGQVVEGVDGRFYWYVPVHEAASTSEDKFGIGVAVSDTPLGPWTDHIGTPLVSQKILNNNAHNIDPTVLVDDGRVWMYWGSFSRLLVQELATDMKTRIGDAAEIRSGITGFFEAPWLFKRKDTYYLAYAANNAGPDSSCTPAVYHACIAYSTASSPTGPWTPRGTILGPVSSTTSHPAIAEFKGDWYMAYHTADAVGGNHFRRSVAIDHLAWDDSVSPARMLPLQTTPVKTDDPTPTSNVARFATSTASNDPIPVQYWKKALNDGIIRPNPLPPDMWGSYGADRPAQQWIQYDWKEPVRIDSSKIQFWNDALPGSGDGVAAPKSWRLQYWKDGAWTDVTGASAYPTATRELHDVTFDAVTTSRLRAVLDAAPGTTTPPRYSALAVEEWEVHAADATGYAPVTVSTLVGETPDLPETVALTYGDQVVAAPVRWNAVDPDELAAPGTFEVEGVAEGYAAGTVTAQVTVVDSTVPRVNQALTGTPAAGYTADWNNLAAINNGTAFSTGGANEEIWATWSPDRPATQKVGYDWVTPVTIDTLTAQFWRDTEGPDAGDGVAVPQSWTVEVLVDGRWVAPEQLSAAGTAPDGPNRVTFFPVTTTGVRAVLNAQTDGTTYAAVGLTELEAIGAPADTTAPTVTLRTAGVDGAGDWFVSPVRAIASATDDRDSTLDIEISVDGGEWSTTEGVRRAEATVTGDGAHTVKARATDAAGNLSAEQSATVSIDATRPTVSGELNATERTVTITGTDAGSEVERLEYALGEPTAWLPYSAPVKVSDDRQVVYVRAIDGAGNESVLTSVTVPRSPNAPLVGNIAPLATPTASYTSGWTSVTSVNDESLTGSSWGTWPVVGEQWLQLEWDREVSLDHAGIQFARDAADEANGGLIPPRSWVLQYRDATGTWKPVSTTGTYGRTSDVVNEVTFTAVTTTALRAVMQAWGAAEMGGSIAVQEFQAWAPTTTPTPTDTTPPTVSVTATGTPVAEGFYAGPVRLALEVDDDHDESPVVRYRVDGGEWVTWSTAPTVDTSGRHVVEYEATDAAGNTSARGTLNVLVDRDAPVTTAATPAFDSAKPETRVGFIAVDPLSGVAEIETRVAGGAWTALPYDGFLRLAPQGAVDVEYRATDRVGNVEAARTLRVTTGETPGPETKPAVTLGGSTVSAGGSLAVVGTGFTPGETVEVWLHSEPVELTKLTADAQGAVTTVVTIPAATPAGEHSIELRSTDGARTASADLTVTTSGPTGGDGGGSTGGVPLTGGGRGPDGKGLASTGVDVTATPFAIGFLLLAAGLVALRRRRRTS